MIAHNEGYKQDREITPTSNDQKRRKMNTFGSTCHKALAIGINRMANVKLCLDSPPSILNLGLQLSKVNIKNRHKQFTN